MVAAASVVVAAGTVSGVISATAEGPDVPEARPVPSASPSLAPLPVVPSASPSVSTSASPSVRPKRPSASASAPPRVKKTTASSGLYRHPASRVLDWVRAHPDDPRRPVIESRIADQPAAVWFADWSPDTVTARVRAVTSGGAAQGRVPVVVPYAIPGRDCGGYSEGGAPDLDAYDGWIDRFAAGLGSGEVVVILEPDSVAQADCLSAGRRAERFASLARAGRVFKQANPRARVYYDAGHSGWHSPAEQADLLRQAGAASPASSDGIFSNVSNFHATADEIAYDRAVLDALGGTGLGAVIDTSRNGNGAPADGEWCDPAGRTLGRAPTLSTGEARIDAYLWVKLPGESDGCKGAPGTFSPSYAYDLAR
ncbi:glycoside hydrolase family 6 protein [Streptomyces cellulosae]